MPPKTLLIVAMQKEEDAVAALLQLSNGSETLGKGSILYQSATSDLLLARVGVGPVSAAYFTAIICERFEVKEIVLLGVGGALTKQLKLGDVVLATGVLQHDALFKDGSDKANLMRPGELYLSLPAEKRPSPVLETDHALTSRLAALLTESIGVAMHRGMLLSGASFVATFAEKKDLATRWNNALMVDMEACGVAFAAAIQGIPFAAAKTVVDRFGEATSVCDEYLSFIDSACTNSAAVARGFAR